MIKITVSGRSDTDDYFKQLDDLFTSGSLNHTPLLAFITSEDEVRVRIVHKLDELLALNDETPVMGQWRGEWRSDFFQFTVGKYRQFIEEKNQPLKSARNVVKAVGPQGGFRSLSYEYINKQGIPSHATVGFKAEAERLEAFFAREGIPIQVVVQKTR